MNIINRTFRSVVFKTGQKTALRALYVVKGSQRHLLAGFENNQSEGPIEIMLIYFNQCND